MAVLSHELLNTIGIDSKIVVIDAGYRSCDGHSAISINNIVYEPRYLGLYKHPNIDYTPSHTFDTTNDYLNKTCLFPPIRPLITQIIPEMIINAIN